MWSSSPPAGNHERLGKIRQFYPRAVQPDNKALSQTFQKGLFGMKRSPFLEEEAFSASYRSSPPFGTSSFHPVHNALHSKVAFTASKRSRNGKLRPERWPEPCEDKMNPVFPNSS